MSAVPKLNYANFRGKSKSKETDNSQRKMEGGSSDLFSHMNQDNLKYIQNQIKAKSKRNKQIVMLKKSEEDELDSPSTQAPLVNNTQIYYQPQQEPSSPEVETKQFTVMKTDGESVRVNLIEDTGKGKTPNLTDKLSSYDLISQDKSKRVPSLQGCLEEQTNTENPHTASFLNFLQGYIDNLSHLGNKKKTTKIKSRNHSVRAQSVLASSSSEKQILKNALSHQKKIIQGLVGKIQQDKMTHQSTQKKVIQLQQNVKILFEQMQMMKNQLAIERSKQYLHMKYQSNIQNDYDQRSSHRKNNSISMTINSQHDRYGQNRMNHSRSHYDQNHYQINYLERELQLFRETGTVQLKQNFRK